MGPEGVFYYCSFVCTFEKRPQLLQAPAAAFSKIAGLPLAPHRGPGRRNGEASLAQPALPVPAQAERPPWHAGHLHCKEEQLSAVAHVSCFLLYDDLGAPNPRGSRRRGPRRAVWSWLFSEARSFLLQELHTGFGSGHGCPGVLGAHRPSVLRSSRPQGRQRSLPDTSIEAVGVLVPECFGTKTHRQILE